MNDALRLDPALPDHQVPDASMARMVWLRRVVVTLAAIFVMAVVLSG